MGSNMTSMSLIPAWDTSRVTTFEVADEFVTALHDFSRNGNIWEFRLELSEHLHIHLPCPGR